MKTDRELTDLAMKAWNQGRAPLDQAERVGNHCWQNKSGQSDGAWRPLTDDGDALRLAVDLRICIEFFGVYTQAGHSGVCCTAILRGQPVVKTDYAKQGESFSAATRRAIVRVAAAIGETMP